MTELERRVLKLETAAGTRMTPEERAAFAELVRALDALARRIAAGDADVQAEARALEAGLPDPAPFPP
jgi:hypothetical protein